MIVWLDTETVKVPSIFVALPKAADATLNPAGNPIAILAFTGRSVAVVNTIECDEVTPALAGVGVSSTAATINLSVTVVAFEDRSSIVPATVYVPTG